MNDEQIRELERRAVTEDAGAAARLVLFNQKLYGGMCGHWLRSKRLWTAEKLVQRLDAFCLYCGMNMDWTPDPIEPPVYWDDCGGVDRKRMLEEAEIERLALAADEYARRAIEERRETERVAALRLEHEWLRSVPDDEVVERWRDELGLPEMPW